MIREQRQRAHALRLQAALARARGDYSEARELLSEAQEIERELGRMNGRAA